MNLFPNSFVCPRPEPPKPMPPTPVVPDNRRVLTNFREGDVIFVQAPGGVCDQGVFLRESDGFLIWARSISGASYIAFTNLNNISITKL